MPINVVLSINHAMVQIPSQEDKTVEQTLAISLPRQTDDEALLRSAEEVKLSDSSKKSFRNTVSVVKISHCQVLGTFVRFEL